MAKYYRNKENFIFDTIVTLLVVLVLVVSVCPDPEGGRKAAAPSPEPGRPRRQLPADGGRRRNLRLYLHF